mgnify:CR=1 FL=1
MGNFLSGFENGSHRLYEDYETEYNRHFQKDNNLEGKKLGPLVVVKPSKKKLPNFQNWRT